MSIAHFKKLHHPKSKSHPIPAALPTTNVVSNARVKKKRSMYATKTLTTTTTTTTTRSVGGRRCVRGTDEIR